MPSKIIPNVYAEVLQNTAGQPVADNSLDVVGVEGTFARGPLQQGVAVSDPSQAALIFGSADNISNPNFLTGMWAVNKLMAQGAKRVVIVRVGAATFATLPINDNITALVAGPLLAGVSIIPLHSNPITAGFLVGQPFQVGVGGSLETLTILSLTPTTIHTTTPTANPHPDNDPVDQMNLVATLQAPTPGTFGNLYTVAIAAGSLPNTVKFTITGDGKQEVWDNLTNTPGTPRYLVTFLNANSVLLQVVAGISPNLPAVLAATSLGGGTNGNVTADADYIGTASPSTGAFVFDSLDVNILVAAGQASAAVHSALNSHAQTKGDRICVVGGAADESVAATTARAAVLASDRAVLVYPGTLVFDPNQNLTVELPSAYTAADVAGLIATLDPFRSPSNHQIQGILGVEVDINDADLATLIQGGVDAITLRGRLGFRLRSGITTSTSAPFNQISIRRLFDQIVRGVTEGNIDLVSQPNNADTQHALKQGITNFLNQLKAQGAIQDFFVNVFSSPADQQAGFLYADVGIAPTFPADFIVIRIKPNDSGSFDSSVLNQQ